MRRAGCRIVVCLVLPLAVTAVALAARAGSYKGRTSQHQNVSFRISAGVVEGFKIVVLDKCPDGHTLSVTANYPRMSITRGAFGGRFVPRGGHSGEHAKLSGKVGRKAVTGSLQDTSFSSREGRLCHGTATFSARHV